MTEFNEPSKVDEELLSAFVDGELRGDELKEVEQRLATDPAARELVDELRTLSSELQSLPIETVGQSLRDSVMQRAERAMLLGTADPPTVPTQQADGSRRWAWAAMAIAATLLLTIYLPSTQQEDETVVLAKSAPSKVPTGSMQIEAREDAATADLPESTSPAADQAESAGNQGATTSDSRQPSDFAKSKASPPVGKARSQLGGERATTRAEVVETEPVTPAMQSRMASSPPSIPEDASQTVGDGLTCEVHITLGDGTQSVAKFDGWLERVGISLEENDRADKPGASSPPTEVLSATRSRALAIDEELPVQYVLVEAPIKPIESALAQCNLDTFNCPTIRVVADNDLPVPNVERLRRWERKADEQPAAESDDPLVQSSAIQAVNQGRATRIDRARLNDADRQQPMQQQRYAKGQAIADDGPVEDPVRVLFVLQQAADLREPTTVETESESPDKR
ncbi:MAG: hypothetical protein AAGD11_16520 [Planctomycetota bacterium]